MFSRDHSCSSLIGRVPEISQKRGRTELSREIASSNSKTLRIASMIPFTVIADYCYFLFVNKTKTIILQKLR